MGAVLEKIENSEAYIAIEVDPDKLEEGLEHAYRKVVKQVSIPGFRQGRVLGCRCRPRDSFGRDFYGDTGTQRHREDSSTLRR